MPVQNTTPPEARVARARASIARQTRRARRRMVVERLTRALWPIWALAAGFLGLALLGLPQALPYLAHWALLAGFAAAGGWLAWRAARGWRTPTRAEAAARLDAPFRDRPVEALTDALSAGAGDPASQGVWAAHQARMAARAEAAKAPRADLRVSDRDPYALRHAALLALAAGLISQLDDGARLAEALVPVAAAPAQAAMAPQPSLEAWASPPAYTRMAPLYLTERRGEVAPIRLPVGSEVVVRVFDVGGAPQVQGAPAGMEAAFAEASGGWTATMTLTGDADILVTAPGADFGGWSLRAIPDHPPMVEITEPPVATRGGALQFDFRATDDYGVASARATIALDAAAAGPRGLAPQTVFEPVDFALPLPLTGSAREAAETVVENLSENPWAGLPVTLTLTVEDGAAQQADATTTLTLPERRFFDPLARALIEQRRELAWSTESAQRVRDVIDAISAHPDDIFTDAAVYLTVRTAMRRLETGLREDRVAEETPGVVDLLWQAAVRIEDGTLTDAERRLRELQQELSEAIERGADDDEIARLMDELRQALNDYLRQLAEQAMQNPQDGQQQPMDPNQMLSQQDLMDMLDQLEQAMRDGMQDLAQQMLEQLAQLLENLQMAQPGQQQGGQGEGGQAMQELQDMIGRQQGLADRSFDALRQGRQGEGQQGQNGEGQQGEGQSRGGQPGEGQQGRNGQQPGGGGLGDIARDQEALRQLLEDLRNGLPGDGGGREALDRADEAMDSARRALEQGDADGALQDQVEALDSLREGAQQLAQEQMEQGGQAQQAGRDGQSGDVRDEDPFGRPRATDGPQDGASVRVPDASAMKRARELMDEIRRRAGDRTRSTDELEYLQRLLDRF